MPITQQGLMGYWAKRIGPLPSDLADTVPSVPVEPKGAEASKTSGVQPSGLPPLRVSRTEASEKLEERIAMGNQIQAEPICSIEDKARLDIEFKQWTFYNYDLLKSLLTTTRFADEYGDPSVREMEGSMPFRPDRAMQWHSKRMSEKLVILLAIRSRLPMYPEPGERSLTIPPKNLPDQKQRRDRWAEAQAFFSYTHFDDKHDQKQLSKLRERLAGEVRTQTGQPFEIFQDRISIRWGQQWEQRIDQTLEDEVTFLIPILTPSYFSSEACQKELELFLKRESRLGRNDLILPILYVDCAMLNDKSKREKDTLVQEIAARQYADWRDLRFSPLNSQAVRKLLADLAKQIRDALEDIRGQ
jgi:hypothetical protein